MVKADQSVSDVHPRYEKPLTLKNGMQVTLRAIRSDDKQRLRDAFAKLETSTIYTRFFGYKKQLSDAELVQATEIDFHSTVALLVTTGDGSSETVIGAGRYVAAPGQMPESAEIAFTVEEDFHGLGIASLLLTSLAEIARENGLKRFEAEVLPGNAAMLVVFRKSGLAMRQSLGDGAVHVTLDLSPGG